MISAVPLYPSTTFPPMIAGRWWAPIAMMPCPPSAFPDPQSANPHISRVRLGRDHLNLIGWRLLLHIHIGRWLGHWGRSRRRTRRRFLNIYRPLRLGFDRATPHHAQHAYRSHHGCAQQSTQIFLSAHNQLLTILIDTTPPGLVCSKQSMFHLRLFTSALWRRFHRRYARAWTYRKSSPGG
jgi:hypothetical protein